MTGADIDMEELPAAARISRVVPTFGRRFMARGIDAVILGGVTVPLALAVLDGDLASGQADVSPWATLILGVVPLAYEVAFVAWLGHTPGKRGCSV